MKAQPNIFPALGAAAWLLWTGTVSAEVVFESLPAAGDFIGMGQVGGLSADGATIVGAGWSVAKWEGQSFRWTRAGGVQFLEASLPLASRGTGTSTDGTVIGGQRYSDYGAAFCWINGVMKSMVANRSSVVSDISKDGKIAVGSNPANRTVTPAAAQWSVSAAGAATAVSLGDLAGGTTESEAKRISGNGTTIVGWGTSANGVEAFRKQGSSAMTGLGDLSGGKFFSEAAAVSSDGSVVVGRSHSAKGPEAFRWTAAGGMVGLGDLPGGADYSEATAVSGDGSIVVGTSSSAADTEVFVWDAAAGMRGLTGLCRSLGVDLNGWRFTYCRPVISEDGNVLSGDAISPQMDQVMWRLEGVRELAAQPDGVYWQGDSIANAWDSANAANWTDGAVTTTFPAGKRAIFDDLGSNEPALNLIGLLSPSGVLVSAAQDYIFGGSGSLAGAMSLVKSGSGMLTLLGNHTFSGGVTVNEGTLVIRGTLVDSGGNGVHVMSGATLHLQGGTLQANVWIHPGGCLSGCGTIIGEVVNDGTIKEECGGIILVNSGGLVNNGTMLFKGGSSLRVAGTLVNNGVMDMISGALPPPGDFVNNGVLLDSSSLQVNELVKEGATVRLGMQSAAEHVYQLQRSRDLGSGTWVNIGPSQAGTGGMLTFTDPGGSGATGFYRIAVDP